ncbi:signal peptidase I [Aeromicrobium sp.]|nr:signal peptidase I [Candidatus Saccharibacteria bacterium]
MHPTNNATPGAPAPEPEMPKDLELPADNTPPPKLINNPIKEYLSAFGVLGTAIGVALLLILFVFQSYQVSGPSMEQTLHDQDRLIVWKLQRSWSRITGHQYIPGRGDVVIFTESGLSEYGQEDTKQLIKRVIALPGERVVVKDNIITVYNKANPNGFQPDKTLPYGVNITEPAEQSVDRTIGKDELFVCGDNRTNSLDSRFFGPIKTNQIIGKLAVRVLPLSDAEKF